MPSKHRISSASLTQTSGCHCAHTTWHQRPSSVCLNAPSCTGHRMHDTPRYIAIFSWLDGLIDPGGAVRAAASTAGVFAFPFAVASLQHQHIHPSIDDPGVDP